MTETPGSAGSSQPTEGHSGENAAGNSKGVQGNVGEAGSSSTAQATPADHGSNPGKLSVAIVSSVNVGYLLPGLQMVKMGEESLDVLVPRGEPRRANVGSEVNEKKKWSPAAWLGFTVSPTAMYISHLERVFRTHGYTRETHSVDDKTQVEAWVPKKFGNHETKTPLLMLHGFGSDATLQWDGQVTVLGKRLDLIMPNLVFFGKSSTTSKERSMTWQADCMVQLMDKLGVRTFDLLGFSYGAAVAYKLGLKYPERIRRVVIADEGIMMTRRDMQDMQEEQGIDDGKGFWKLPSTPAEMRKLEQIAFQNPMPVPDVIYKDVLNTLFSTNIKEWEELIVEYTTDRPDNPYDNKPLPHPVLFIWGEEDPMAPLRFAKMQARHFGTSSRLLAIRGAKHMAHAEFPKEWNAVALDFLISEDAKVHGGLAGDNVMVHT